MIIWLDKNRTLHIDKNNSADNAFALSKYTPATYSSKDVLFKANAVVSGSILLLTHSQVNSDVAGELYCRRYNCRSTLRKYFFDTDLKEFEHQICDHLRRTKGYNKEIKLRFRIGKSNIDQFKKLGYNFYKDSDTYTDYYNLPWMKFIIVEKIL